jgi:crossover junction endodeoxyribonuclease RuvC
MEMYRRGVRWTDVPPPVLKKWITGKGNADKKKMAQAVCEKWQFVSKSDDVVDAYALARLAQRLAEVNAEFKKGLKNEDL